MVALSPLSPRNWNEDMRPITFNPSKRDSVSIRFSERPSEKNCCSGSLLALTSGSTAIECSTTFGRVGAVLAAAACAVDPACCAGGTRPRKNHPTAMAMSAAAIKSMRLRPEVLTSSFTPSGVSSSAQAMSTAMGKPSANSRMIRRSAQTGRSNAGRMVAVTCTSSQATAR